MAILRSCGLMACVMAFVAAMILGLNAQSLVSGDERGQGGDARKGLFSQGAQGRNFDWDRPKAAEILENPADVRGARPYLRNVRPWRSELKIEAQRPPENWNAKANEVVTPVTVSRWARPSTQQIVANPATGIGARPYARSVGPGVALRQGDVTNYEGTAYRDQSNRRVAPVAGGTSAGNDDDKLDKSEPAAGGADSKSDEKKEAGALNPLVADKTEGSAVKGEQREKNGISPPRERQRSGALDTNPDSGAGRSNAPTSANSGTAGERVDVAATDVNPSAAQNDKAKGNRLPGPPGGAPNGNADGSSKTGSAQGATGGAPDGKEDGDPGGGGPSGGLSTDPNAGQGGPGIREYLAGVQVASAEVSGPLAVAMLKLFDGVAPPRVTPTPTTAATENKSAQAVLTTDKPAADVPPSTPSSWWQSTWAAVKGIWANVWGPDDAVGTGKAELSKLPPSVRGDIR